MFSLDWLRNNWNSCLGTITSTGPEQPSDTSLWRIIGKRSLQCIFCGIGFPDQTLYFLHKGCHSDSNPWKCNICGEQCCNVYEFNSHLLSKSHQWQWIFRFPDLSGIRSTSIPASQLSLVLFWFAPRKCSHFDESPCIASEACSTSAL